MDVEVVYFIINQISFEDDDATFGIGYLVATVNLTKETRVSVEEIGNVNVTVLGTTELTNYKINHGSEEMVNAKRAISEGKIFTVKM